MTRVDQEKEPPVSLSPLPFSWSAVRQADPHAKKQGKGNVGHLRMDEAYQMGKWRKEAGYILCASPVTARDPHWQAAESVTCQTCLERAVWFMQRYTQLKSTKGRDGEKKLSIQE